MIAKRVKKAVAKKGERIIHKGEQLGWGVVLSSLVHVLLVAVIVLWPGLTSSNRRDFVPTYNVNLVAAPKLETGPPAAAPKRASAPQFKPQPKPKPQPQPKPKVKIEAKPKPKPKAVVKPKPKPKPKPKRRVVRRQPPKPTAKPKVAIGTKKTVKRKPKTVERKTVDRSVQESKALERRLRSLQARVSQKRKITRQQEERLDDVLSSLKSKVAKREAQEEVARPQPRPTAVASSGPAAPLPSGSSSGSGSSKLTMRQQIYNAEVESRIKRQWVLPEAYVKETSGLVAWVVLRIKRDGHLAKVWLEQSSGNSRFDQSCLRAVKKAAPFPTLPPEERGQTMELGIRFRPSDIG